MHHIYSYISRNIGCYFTIIAFALLTDLYERGSIVLTSNLLFSQWEEIFKEPMTTAAEIDRLVHHGVILDLNVVSYRLEHAQEKFQVDDATVNAKKTEKKWWCPCRMSRRWFQ
jgi:hypothetical protein